MNLLPCLLALTTISLNFWSAESGDITCAKGFIYKKCGPGKSCIKSCKYPNPSSADCYNCVPGCYCPEGYYETCTLNGFPKCVDSLKKCVCPSNMVYQQCKPCKKTCNNLSPVCPAICIPGCGCPAKTPVWLNGKCVKESQCICPDKCATNGCKECNMCMCRNGKVRGCTKKGCPNLNTKAGFNSLKAIGCWRLCPSGKRCIFYSPCPDNFNPSCESFPHGFCKECNKCTCPAGTPICTLKGCIEPSYQTSHLGCYRLIKGTCTYVYPCPEQPSKKNCCQCCKAGQMSCKECHECECVHALKICNKGICPDPTQKSNGCYVVRSYPGYPKGCFFVSPCPSTGSDKCVPGKEYCNNCLLCKCGQPCPLPKCIDPKLDSCYLYNDKLGHCEFVSPCPQCCCEGEMTCRECNECVCKDGKTKCSQEKCGNPIKKGCYVKKGNRCEFTIPCPPNAVLDPQKFCEKNPGETFCKYNDCNLCKCPASYPGPIVCTLIACSEPVGCWRATDGYCKFFYPCPN